MTESRGTFMSRLRMPSKISRPAAVQSTPTVVTTTPVATTATRPANQSPAPASLTDVPANGSAIVAGRRPTAAVASTPTGHGYAAHGQGHVAPSPARTPGKPLFHSSAVVKTSAQPSSSSKPAKVSQPSTTPAAITPRGMTKSSSLSHARSTPAKAAPKNASLQKSTNSSASSNLKHASLPTGKTPQSSQASVAPINSVKKPTRTASLKAPPKTPSPEEDRQGHTVPSTGGLQSLKTRAKSLKLPGRARASPVPSKMTASAAKVEQQPNGRNSSQAESARTTAAENAEQYSSPSQNLTSGEAPGSNLSTPSPSRGLARFGFGRSSKNQAPTPVAKKSNGDGLAQNRLSPSAAGGKSSDEIKLMRYDSSPARKAAVAHRSPRVNRPLSEAIDVEDPLTVSSMPAHIGRSAPATCDLMAEDEHELLETGMIQSSREESLNSMEISVDQSIASSEGNRDNVPHLHETAIPEVEIPAGLTDASPSLPHHATDERQRKSGQSVKFGSIAPMSLLGPEVQQAALSSISQAPQSHSTSHRGTARSPAQKGDTMPYKVESRRRSGSIGECILSTSSPSPPSSPVRGRPRTPSAPIPMSAVAPVESEHDTPQLSSSLQSSSKQQQQQSNYFRHAVAMAQRTPVSSLKESKMKMLSGSTPSLSHLSASKQRPRASPSGPYVILEIETYRQMQSEIKTLKSLLLQLKRELQDTEGDSLGIPHHTSDSGSALTPSKDSVRSLELYASDRMQ